MKVSTKEFWKTAFAAKLFRPDEGKRLWETFRRARPDASKDDALPLAEWLVRAGALSKYQAKSLLRGHKGPFFVEEYEIVDRVMRGRLQGMCRAIHQPSRHLAGLWSERRLQGEEFNLWKVQADRHFPAAEHPHLVRNFHELKMNDRIAVALEDLHGESLEESLEKNGSRLPVGVACRYALQLALGLAALHERGLAHGDVRDANCWLDRSGSLKLLHAPIAWGSRLSIQQAIERSSRGEPAPELSTLAPELSQGLEDPARASDLYSLGVMLFSWISGRHPATRDAGETMDDVTGYAPAKLADLAPETPSEVCEIVQRLLSEDPASRPGQGGEVAAAVAQFMTLSAVEPPPIPPTAAAYDSWLGKLTARVITGSTTAPQPVASAAAARGEIPQEIRSLAAPSDSPDWRGDSSKTELRAASGHKRKNISRLQALVASVVAVTCVLVMLGVWWLSWHSDQKPALAPSVASVPAPIVENTEGEPPAPTDAVKEDSKAAVTPPLTSPVLDALVGLESPLWASPTEGKPWDMKYLSPGAQAIFAFHPAKLLQHPEGERLTDPIVSGAIGTWWKSSLAKLAGLEPKEIESAIIAICETSNGPALAAVIRPVETIDEKEWVVGWGSPQVVEEEGRRYFRSGERAWTLQSDRRGQVAVMAPASEMPGMFAAEFAAPPLSSDFERLVAESDSERLATAIVKPRYLLEEKTLWGEDGEVLRKAVDAFLLLEGTKGQFEPPKALMASLHLADSLFVELRIPNSFGGMTTAALAEKFRNKIRGISSDLLNYLGGHRASAYANRVLLKFPLMLRELDLQTRYGATRDQAVLRAYLPEVAAHNLALATRLSLAEVFDANFVAAAQPSQTAPAAPSGPTTSAALLDKKITVAFSKNTLEQALEMVSQETGVEISVMGADFQAVGITRNGTLTDVEERDKPARDILKSLLAKANPAGLLIYTYQPKEGGGEVVQVTTRAAATERGDKIPPEWQTK